MNDYTKYSDTELSSLLRSGNHAVFKEIYDRYNKLLYSFAYNKLRKKEEAMDVVHDVFSKVLHSEDKFALKTSLSSYLFKSVLNTIIDLHRRQL